MIKVKNVLQLKHDFVRHGLHILMILDDTFLNIHLLVNDQGFGDSFTVPIVPELLPKRKHERRNSEGASRWKRGLPICLLY